MPYSCEPTTFRRSKPSEFRRLEMLGLMLRPKYGVKVPSRTAVGRGIYRVRRILYSMEISGHVLYSPYWKRMLPLVKMAIRSPFHIFRKAD